MWDDDGPDYMDSTYIPQSPSFEWQWAVSDIINAVIGAGLELEFFHEFEALSDPVFPDMSQRPDGMFAFGGSPVALPIVFSLRARRKELCE